LQFFIELSILLTYDSSDSLSVRHVPVFYRNDSWILYDSLSFYFYEYQTASWNFDGSPLRGRYIQVGYKNFAIFDQQVAISQTIQDSAVVTMEGEYETVTSFW